MKHYRYNIKVYDTDATVWTMLQRYDRDTHEDPHDAFIEACHVCYALNLEKCDIHIIEDTEDGPEEHSQHTLHVNSDIKDHDLHCLLGNGTYMLEYNKEIIKLEEIYCSDKYAEVYGPV